MQNRKNRTFDDEIHHYLKTGDCNSLETLAPGNNICEKMTNQYNVLVSALTNEVANRTKECNRILLPKRFDSIHFIRNKCTPMVKGLFQKKEMDIVMKTMEKSCVFLTSDSIARILQNQKWLSTSWSIANVYLKSLGAKTLSKDCSIIGLSEETTFYISMEYFSNTDPFDDWVVHEAAHIFHNVKRRQIGLPSTRNKVWPLNIDFSKRETFAYLCEVYSRIKEQAKYKAERVELFEKHSNNRIWPSKEFIDLDEFLENLKVAVQARNGWKCILKSCQRKKSMTKSK